MRAKDLQAAYELTLFWNALMHIKLSNMNFVKKTIRKITISLLFLMFATVHSETNGILRIRKIYESAQKFRKTNLFNSIQYWDEKNNDLSDWEKVDRNSTYENDILRFLQIHKNHGRVILILLEEATPSGDWVFTVEYYFYGNNKLAFVHSILSTFHGFVRVEKRIYSDEDFRKIKELKSIYDLQTNKKLESNKNEFLDHKVVLAKGVDSLLERLQMYHTF
ncbi:hypothetical protein HGB47_17705 [Leptospira yasudae]|uniref:hypothetical protein n=1 Tax=Leptospira yasudae TaxID=2202201 RepID=UPI001C4F5B83|nr:hypothetical protein [Leptospira yasudae]MBW0435447.1 hypothetical protein [Leptospira yasudae]